MSEFCTLIILFIKIALYSELKLTQTCEFATPKLRHRIIWSGVRKTHFKTHDSVSKSRRRRWSWNNGFCWDSDRFVSRATCVVAAWSVRDRPDVQNELHCWLLSNCSTARLQGGESALRCCSCQTSDTPCFAVASKQGKLLEDLHTMYFRERI